MRIANCIECGCLFQDYTNRTNAEKYCPNCREGIYIEGDTPDYNIVERFSKKILWEKRGSWLFKSWRN